MPFETLRIIPSVDVEETLADNAQGISESNYIRWRDKLPERRGGSTLFQNELIQYEGAIVDLHPWQGLNAVKQMGVATETNLYVYTSGPPKNITPRYENTSVAIPLDTTSGDSIVTVTDPDFEPTKYDTVVFNTPVSVGGLVLNGAYKVVQYLGSNQYTIDAGANATATVTNGGAVPEFDTTSGSNEVAVTLADSVFNPSSPYPNTVGVGDIVNFRAATTVGGITIYGSYIVISVNTSTYDEFTINASNEATSTANADMNGNEVSFTYWVTLGPAIVGSGYGVYAYGGASVSPDFVETAYGTGSATAGAVNPGTKLIAQDYYLDNWGETLIATAEVNISTPSGTVLSGGPIFTWSPLTGYYNASIIPTAPLANFGAFVAMPQQQLMAWGSTYSGESDPLQIRWSDAGDYTVWTPTATNQAGGYHIPTGSKIQRGFQGPTQQYWWTDIDLYVSQYVGAPFVYGFSKIGAGCGLIGSKAVAQLNSTIYWMSQKQFFMVSSSNAVQPIPCSVWDFIFQNMDWANIDNVEAAANSQFNEVTWFFPSLTGDNSYQGQNNAYACYNVLYNEWDYGYINRVSWCDQSIWGSPVAAASNGYLYQHDVPGIYSDNGVPQNSGFKTGYFSLTNGNDLVFVDWMLPDMKWGEFSSSENAKLLVSFNVTDYTGQTPTLYGPFEITKDTEYIEPRFRGRFVQIIIETQTTDTDPNAFWRLGSFRYRYSMSGRR